MEALHFFYYKMGDKLWKDYGFIDAFNLTADWYDTQYIAKMCIRDSGNRLWKSYGRL